MTYMRCYKHLVSQRLFDEIFPNTEISLKTLLIISAIISASVERSYSKVQIIKIYLSSKTKKKKKTITDCNIIAIVKKKEFVQGESMT